MLKVAVLGAGHLGKIHIKLLKEIEAYQLVGFYDTDESVRKKVEEEMGVPAFESMEQAIAAADVLDIVAPTSSHFSCAKAALENAKHVFIEKPLTDTVDEAEDLLELLQNTTCKAQVGHVERFNPAYLSIANQSIEPLFIEAHRIAQFNPRGTDVPVVMDLMIHDIDIVLQLVNSKVRDIQASGVAILSETPDIANARISFENGCVANLTASRISMKKMRKMRVFQADAYVSIDFLEKKSSVLRLSDIPVSEMMSFPIEVDNLGTKKYINFEQPEIPDVNAIKEELTLFAESILNDTPVAVSIEEGLYAMKIAGQILEQIQVNQARYLKTKV